MNGSRGAGRKALFLPPGLLLCALLLGGGCGFFEGKKPNILLLSIDTLRADHLGCYGNDRWGRSPSPHLDALAARGVIFERCYAPRGQTHPSIASMLTGKYPITHGLRENGQGLSEHHPTLAQLLKKAGYATAGFASNLPVQSDPVQDPEHSPPAWWTRGFETCGDGFGGNFAAETGRGKIEDQWRWDERVERQVEAWIESYAGGDRSRPFFLWAHFYDPHKPYLPDPSCPDFFPDYEGPLEPETAVENGRPVDRVGRFIDQATRAGRELAPADHRKVLALYDASLWGVDQRIGRILEALEKRGLLENTWIFFTADHGEELGDHNAYYYHGASIYNAVLHIPFIAAGPGVPAGRRLACLVQNVDLSATVMDLAGVEPPPLTEGIPLTAVLEGKADDPGREFYAAEWQAAIYAYSDGRYKYIFNPGGTCPKKPPFIAVGGSFKYERFELYDLEADPGERRNILEGHKDTAKALRKRLLRWLNEPGHDPTGRASILSSGMNRAMQQLGYTGADTPGGGRGGR